MKANILSVGLTAPGLVNFESFKALMLSGQEPNVSEPLEKYSPAFLPANERRRTTATIKLALKTAEEALTNYKEQFPEADLQIPVLFVCKDGDTLISARMCQAVSEVEPMISPTQFHNSVHNAPAGYWMIGQENQAPASAISVGQYAIANGLLEAVLQSQSEMKPVLVVTYDLPLDDLMPVNTTQKGQLPFAFSLILDASGVNQSGHQKSKRPELSLSLTQAGADQQLDNPYQGLPAAEGYPLLQAIALFQEKSEEMTFPLNEHNFVKLALS